MTDDRLGGALAQRPLHFFWVLDVSGSMAADGKIQALNVAVREAAPHRLDAARANPGAEVLVRVLTFGSTLRWVVPEPTPIATFRWTDVTAEPQGLTEFGSALHALAAEMRALEAHGRGFAPAVVVVSDGQPTDTVAPSFRAGLEELRATSWGDKAVRLAVAIGRDADPGPLRSFIGRGEIEPVRADTPQQLAEGLRFVSTVAVRAASRLAGRSDLLEHRVSTTLPVVPPDGPVW